MAPDAWKRLKRNRPAVAGLVAVAILAAAGGLAPWVAPLPYDAIDLSRIAEPPGLDRLFGTDPLGRDILSRLIYGARVSLSMALVVQLVSAGVGVTLGLMAGYHGGWTDTVITRLSDIVFAFPRLLFALIVSAILGPGLRAVSVAIILTGWPEMARLVRGQVLVLRDSLMVEAARALGVRPSRVMLRHILPNTVGPLIVRSTMGISRVIMVEATMSFLGIGIQPPLPSWGSMISEGIPYLRTYPHMAVIPSLALSLTVLAFNFFGDGLRDALDPRMRR